MRFLVALLALTFPAFAQIRYSPTGFTAPFISTVTNQASAQAYLGISGGGGGSVTNFGGSATNLQVYSSGTTNQPLRVWLGTQTNSNPAEISGVFNNASVNFSAFKVNVTNTASAAASKVADFQVDGTSVTYIDKNGTLNVTPNGTVGPIGGDNWILKLIGATAGFVVVPGGDNSIMTYSAGSRSFAATGSYVVVPNASLIGWSSSPGAAGPNLSFARNSSDVVEINNGTANQHRDLRLRTLEMYAQPSDPSSSATLGMIYAKTNAGTTEVFVMDGAGNVTQISPHARAASPAPPELDTDAQPIVIHHANLFLGTEEFLHLSALAKEVEKLSGKKFLFQRQLDPARKRDWTTEETAIEQRHAAERAADMARLSDWQSNTNQNKGPQPPVRPAYVKRPKPAWLP